MSDEDNTDEATRPFLGKNFNLSGLIAIIVFYLIILLVGLWAGWRQKKKLKKSGRKSDTETVMIADRDIGLAVGLMTMGATWVGGGFINGTAEMTYKAGLVWTLAPFGYGLSLFVSGQFFAQKMRESRYVTMIDPFTQKYGKFGALQALPAAVSEIFWSASILGALGSTIKVILDIDKRFSVIISAIISVAYTLMGGLVSVAYTDVFQLAFMVIGLFLALPFAFTNKAVGNIGNTEEYPWLGTLEAKDVGIWIDTIVLLICGGVPWQCYYQRVLSAKSSTRAKFLSFGGGAIALFMTVPSFLFGAIAKATDWSQTVLEIKPSDDEAEFILPLVLQYLTPGWVAFFGLGAISAAVMSSTDSSMLSAASMLTRNVYKNVFRPKASEKELLVVMSVLVAFNCSFATLLALTFPGIYGLFEFCGDLVFIIVFPQLLSILYLEKYCNTYGSVTAFVIGIILRLLIGIKIFGIPETISFGHYYTADGEMGEMPNKTITMLISLVIHITVSFIADYLFTREKLPLKYDFFGAFEENDQGLINSATSRSLEMSDSSSCRRTKNPESKF